MKRSNSTGSMVSALFTGMDGNRRRRNSIGQRLKGKRFLSVSNTSLPVEPATVNMAYSPPAGTTTMQWSSPVKQHHQQQQTLSFTRINSPTSRVVQLRKEESIDERVREVEQDREVTSQIQLNQSWGELKLDDDDSIRTSEMMETLPCPVAMTTGIQFSSPSSPVNISSRVRSRSLTPTSPSSSRTFTYRRSLSPAPLRPSSLVFQPQRKRQRNSEHDEMDISPTQLHPPAKRAVFQSPLTGHTPCTSPLLATQGGVANNHLTKQTSSSCHAHPTPPKHFSRPAFDTTHFQTFNNHPDMSYDHAPLLSSGNSAYSTDHTHQQCMESAFMPFKSSNGLTTPTSSQQLQLDESHFDSSLNHPVTTIS